MSLAMVVSYLPWYNFSAVLKYLSQEIALTAADTGVIIAAFQAGYVLVVLLTGWLADRVGVRRVVLAATLGTAVFATAFVFVVHDKTTVLIMRLLTGCAAGAIYVPGMALIANWFPPNERGGALGAYTGALTAASAGGYFIAGPIAAAYGWRLGMLWTSLPVFLAFVLIWLFVEEKPATELHYDGAADMPLPAPRGGYGGPIVITTAYMGHMWELYAFWGWVGPFLVACASTAGMSDGEAVRWGGLTAAWITLAGAPAVWLMGRAADRLGRTKTIVLCSTCSIVAEFCFGYLIGGPLPLIVLCGLWLGFWVIADSAVFKAGLTDMVAPEVRATSLGVQSALGYTMTVAAPVIFGQVLQYYNGVGDPTSAKIWGPAFAALGAVAILAPLSALALRRMAQARLMAGGKL